MSLDRIQSKKGLLQVSPETTADGYPGGMSVGNGFQVLPGAAANTGGAVASRHQYAAGTVDTGGTITHNGNGTVVYGPSTDASKTGVIVQAGTVPGQVLRIVNTSASRTLTMAVAATSNVANGTSCVISALAAITLVWNQLANSGAGYWYQVRAA